LTTILPLFRPQILNLSVVSPILFTIIWFTYGIQFFCCKIFHVHVFFGSRFRVQEDIIGTFEMYFLLWNKCSIPGKQL
jgi:hypothetical protein